MKNKLTIPVIQGGMGVGISLSGLAGAVAREGGMGVISTAVIGFREHDALKNRLAAGKRALRREIAKAREIAEGNGLIAINAMVVTTDYEAMVREAVDCGVDAVISGAGLPLALPEYTAGSRTLIAPIVSSARAARLILSSWRKKYDRAADFLVVEGKDAGGHLGFAREELQSGRAKSLGEIVREVIATVKGIPVFAAGSIFGEEDIREARRWGADGVQIATRFIATEECDASSGFKEIVLAAGEEEARIIESPVGLPGRALDTPLIRRVAEGVRQAPSRCIDCIRTCDPRTTPYCISRALIEAYKGNREEGLFFAGANVGRVNRMTTVRALMKEFKRGFTDREREETIKR